MRIKISLKLIRSLFYMDFLLLLFFYLMIVKISAVLNDTVQAYNDVTESAVKGMDQGLFRKYFIKIPLQRTKVDKNT